METAPTTIQGNMIVNRPKPIVYVLCSILFSLGLGSLLSACMTGPAAALVPVFADAPPRPLVTHVWGYTNTREYVTAMTQDPISGNIYVGGQRRKEMTTDKYGPHVGVGYVCQIDDLNGCLDEPLGGLTVAITPTQPPTRQHESMVEGVTVFSDTLYIVGKAALGGEVEQCSETEQRDRHTDGWLQSRPLTDLSAAAVSGCHQPIKAKNNEGLAVVHHNGHVYWGGTEWNHITGDDQDGVVYRQADSLADPITHSFYVTGAKLAEVFGIEVRDATGVVSPTLIYITGRADSDVINDVCKTQVIPPTDPSRNTDDVCSGAYGSDTTMFVAGLTADTLDLVWLYMDNSVGGNSSGSALEYYNSGGEEGLIVAGHYYEGKDCNRWQGGHGTDPEYNLIYPNTNITYLKLTNGMFYTDSLKHSIQRGEPCEGDSLTDLSLHGNIVYAVGGVRGCETHTTCESEDAVIQRYVISNSMPISIPSTVGSGGVTTVTAQLLFEKSWIYPGYTGGGGIDGTDRFLDVYFDGQHVHVGGLTRSDVFLGRHRTGIQDSLYLKFSVNQLQ